MVDEEPTSGADADSEPVGAVVVRESSYARDLLFGFLTLVIALAAVRGLVGHSGGQTLAAAIVVSIVLVLIMAGWIFVWRNPYRIEVSVERVRYLGRDTKEYPDFVRGHGTELWLYTRPAGRTDRLVVEQRPSGQQWVLRFFARQQIIDACQSRGWSVESTPRRPG